MANALNWTNSALGSGGLNISELGSDAVSRYLESLGYGKFRDENWSNPAYQVVNQAAIDAGLQPGQAVTDEAAIRRDWIAKNLGGYTYQEAMDGPMAYDRLLDPNGSVVASGDYNTNDSGWFEKAVPLVIASMAAAGLGTALGGGGAGAAGSSGAAGSLTGAGALDAYAAMDAAYGAAGLGSGATGAGLAAGGAGLGAGATGGAGVVSGGGGITGTLGGAAGAGGAGSVLPSIGGSVAGGGLSGLIGTGLSTVGNLIAADKAGDAISDATSSANALQRYMYDTTRADNMPALTARNNALTGLQSLLSNPSSITSDPGYSFGLNEGTKALNTGAAARGMTYSGAQQKALQRYGQDYAGTKLNESFNRLASLAGLGQTGAGTIAGAGSAYANNVGNNTTALGSALASQNLLTGQTIGNAINGLTAYGQRQQWWGG